MRTDSASSNISNQLCENIEKIKNDLGNCSDLSIRYINEGCDIAILYMKGLVDKSALITLSKELNDLIPQLNKNNEGIINSVHDFKSFLLNTRSLFEETSMEALYNYLLSGFTIIIIDGSNTFFAIETFEVQGRSVDEPTSQTVIRGPKEGFTEKIGVNISLVRKRIKNTDLRVDELNLGSMTNTKIALMYIDKIAKDEIVEEIKKRLDRIEIDSVLESAYIEELIKDNRYSIFPTTIYSEKPDSVAAALLEGRVAILIDGTGFVLTAPALFFEFINSSEDYYHNFIISSFIRILRFLALILTLLVPATYIALVTFHQEVIPTPLLISIAAQREGVPFPALIEGLIMEITFEILREAGVRMPRAIGPAISIVGALVLGQAAVEAGVVSAIMIIIVSITAISSFVIPNYSLSNAIRLIRFGLMLLAGSFGLYGVFLGLITMILHLCSIKSIGIPYLSPLAPKIKYGYRDTLLRFPLWRMSPNSGGIKNINKPRVTEKSPVSVEFNRKQEFR